MKTCFRNSTKVNYLSIQLSLYMKVYLAVVATQSITSASADELGTSIYPSHMFSVATETLGSSQLLLVMGNKLLLVH